jgi:deoxyribonuclease V
MERGKSQERLMDRELEDMARRQRELAARVVDAPADLPPPADRRVLALDVQYQGGLGHVAGSLWRGAEELGTYCGALSAPVAYVPGYFCFREGPLLLALVRRLQAEGHGFDLLVVDGHGIAHPRRFGAACWLGIACDLPAVGCAKEPLLPERGDPGPERGSFAPVRLGEEEVGSVLRTQTGINPVYVSPGHRIDLAGAREALLSLPGRYRLPDPLRRADHAARMRARGGPPQPGEGTDLGPLEPARPPWG